MQVFKVFCKVMYKHKSQSLMYIVTQTSHIKNVTRTLKNQYFSSQISILLDVLCAAQCLLHIFWQPLYKVGCKFFQLTFGYMKVFHNSIH